MQVPCLNPIDGLLAPCCVWDVVRGCGGDADILGETGCNELSRGLWVVSYSIEECNRQERWMTVEYIAFCSFGGFLDLLTMYGPRRSLDGNFVSSTHESSHDINGGENVV
jgi:hypothetical protein